MERRRSTGSGLFSTLMVLVPHFHLPCPWWTSRCPTSRRGRGDAVEFGQWPVFDLDASAPIFFPPASTMDFWVPHKPGMARIKARGIAAEDCGVRGPREGRGEGAAAGLQPDKLLNVAKSDPNMLELFKGEAPVKRNGKHVFVYQSFLNHISLNLRIPFVNVMVTQELTFPLELGWSVALNLMKYPSHPCLSRS